MLQNCIKSVCCVQHGHTHDGGMSSGTRSWWSVQPLAKRTQICVPRLHMGVGRIYQQRPLQNIDRTRRRSEIHHGQPSYWHVPKAETSHLETKKLSARHKVVKAKRLTCSVVKVLKEIFPANPHHEDYGQILKDVVHELIQNKFAFLSRNEGVIYISERL